MAGMKEESKSEMGKDGGIRSPDAYMYAIDTSGSTGGSHVYYNNVIRIAHLHDSPARAALTPLRNSAGNNAAATVSTSPDTPAPDPADRHYVSWNSGAGAIDARALQELANHQGGDGGTDIGALARHVMAKKFKGHLVIVTDGQVPHTTVVAADQTLRSAAFESVAVHIVPSGYSFGDSVDLSVGAPFIRNTKNFAIHVYDQSGELETLTEGASRGDVKPVLEKLDVEGFEAQYDALYSRILAQNLGCNNFELRDVLLKMRARLLKEVANRPENKLQATTATAATALEAHEYETARNVLQRLVDDYYVNCGGDATGITAKVEALIRLCTSERVYSTSMLDKTSMLARTGLMGTPVEDAPPAPPEQATFGHECPILMSDDLPVLLIAAPEDGLPLFESLDLDKDALDNIAANPLACLYYPKLVAALRNSMDSAVGSAYYEMAVARNGRGNVRSPFSRRKVLGVLAFGNNSANVRATNWTLAHLTTGGKLLGNSQLWYLLLWWLLRSDANGKELTGEAEQRWAAEGHTPLRQVTDAHLVWRARGGAPSATAASGATAAGAAVAAAAAAGGDGGDAPGAAAAAGGNNWWTMFGGGGTQASASEKEKRVQPLHVKLALSGLPDQPLIDVPLQVALWYCTQSTYWFGSSDSLEKVCRDRMRQLSGFAAPMLAALETLDLDYGGGERMRRRLRNLVHFNRLMRSKAAREHAADMWRASYQNHMWLPNKRRFVFLDGPATDPSAARAATAATAATSPAARTAAEDEESGTEVERSAELEDTVGPADAASDARTAVSDFSLAAVAAIDGSDLAGLLEIALARHNQKAGHVAVPLEFPQVAPPAAQVNYSAKANAETPFLNTGIPICPATLRPYLVDTKSGKPWLQASEELFGPIDKQLSMYRLYTSFVVDNKAFPEDDFEAYALHAQASQMNRFGIGTLPAALRSDYEAMCRAYGRAYAALGGRPSGEQAAVIMSRSMYVDERQKMEAALA